MHRWRDHRAHFYMYLCIIIFMSTHCSCVAAQLLIIGNTPVYLDTYIETKHNRKKIRNFIKERYSWCTLISLEYHFFFYKVQHYNGKWYSFKHYNSRKIWQWYHRRTVSSFLSHFFLILQFRLFCINFPFCVWRWIRWFL